MAVTPEIEAVPVPVLVPEPEPVPDPVLEPEPAPVENDWVLTPQPESAAERKSDRIANRMRIGELSRGGELLRTEAPELRECASIWMKDSPAR